VLACRIWFAVEQIKRRYVRQAALESAVRELEV
jgi:hypothetical protein